MEQGRNDSRSVLRSVEVRVCRRDELEQFKALLLQHHYLGFRGVVGESLAQVAEADGQWLALLLWAAAAFKCTPREAWIGWHPALAWQRLYLVANNVRFLMLPGVSVPNLASRILGLSVRRLSSDWQRAWGHPILLVETFVDPARFSGCCYRAAGWVAVGQTRGFARRSGGWSYHGHRKLVLVRELERGARQALRDPSPHPSLQRGVATMKLRPKEIASLLQVLRQIPDPRHRRGVRHSKLSLLAIAVTSVLSGIRSLEGMAQWARECTQGELQRLGCRRHPRTRRFQAPSEPALRRFLQRIDADSVDRRLSQWVVGLCVSDQEPLAFDGKTVRGARREDGTQVHLLSAVLQSSGLTVAQLEVDSKSNEIPAARPLLEPLALAGRCVTADAMHTQKGLARFLVEEKNADYCFTVKDNQPTLKENLDTLFDSEVFPPSGQHARQGPRAPGEPSDLHLDRAE